MKVIKKEKQKQKWKKKRFIDDEIILSQSEKIRSSYLWEWNANLYTSKYEIFLIQVLYFKKKKSQFNPWSLVLWIEYFCLIVFFSIDLDSFLLWSFKETVIYCKGLCIKIIIHMVISSILKSLKITLYTCFSLISNFFWRFNSRFFSPSTWESFFT